MTTIDERLDDMERAQEIKMAKATEGLPFTVYACDILAAATVADVLALVRLCRALTREREIASFCTWHRVGEPPPAWVPKGAEDLEYVWAIATEEVDDAIAALEASE